MRVSGRKGYIGLHAEPRTFVFFEILQCLMFLPYASTHELYHISALLLCALLERHSEGSE